MKIRWVFLLILMTGILTVMFLLRPKPPIAEVTEPTADRSAKAVTAGSSAGTPQNVTHVAVPATPPPTVINSTPSVSNSTALQNVIAKFVESKNKPVNFYGQVIDQNSNALPGVNIEADVEQITVPDASFQDFAGSKYVKVVQVTDQAGRFAINGMEGSGFGIRLTKDGYETEPGQTSFGPVGGSYGTPVMFKMWRANIHEQLITGNKSFEIVPDGRPYFIDLKDGSISENKSGDLEVWIQYTNQVNRGQLYSWSAGINAMNGGICEVPQEAINSGFGAEPPIAMYSAPESGYVPSFSVTKQIKGGKSGEMGNRFFYLLLNNGTEYGKMSVNMFAPYGDLHPGLIRISYALNPSGSRILR